MTKNKKKIKKPKKRNQKVEAGAMAIIPYSEIAKPEVYKGKYTIVPTPFTNMQIEAIIAPTPKQIVKSRPGKGGGNWDYVPGWWFKKKLNFVFGFSHDFDILGERIDGDFITVKGKITVRNPKTGQAMASKTDFGGAEIKYKRGTKNYLDISNDFKAAATDAFKRCAVQLGFAMDIYGKSESVNEGYQVSGNGNGGGCQVIGREVEKGKGKVQVIEVTAVDYITQVKSRLFKMGAKTEKEALKILKEKTGLIWKDFKITQKQGQIALANLLNSRT